MGLPLFGSGLFRLLSPPTRPGGSVSVPSLPASPQQHVHLLPINAQQETHQIKPDA